MEELEKQAVQIQIWLFIDSGNDHCRMQTEIFDEFTRQGIVPEKIAEALARLMNKPTHGLESEELIDGGRIFRTT